MNRLLSDPHNNDSYIVRSKNNEPYALIIFNSTNNKILIVEYLRVLKSKISTSLSRHLAFDLISRASNEKKELIVIQENFLNENIEDSLRDNYFFYENDQWNRLVISIMCNYPELFKILDELIERYENIANFLKKLKEHPELFSNDYRLLIQIEKALWPLKIIGGGIPTFMIPIQPRWAMHLFDIELAKQSLFGCKTGIMFNYQNIYYRSNRSSPKNFTYPARILWYVTKDKNNNFYNDKSVRACSYLDEVVVDYPKKLFSRFHKLGIYSWNDVYSTAKKDLNNKIQSILFSNTELFKNPVYISDITKIWNKYNRSKFHIQSPIYIKEEIFKEIYQLGQNLL